MGRCIYPVALTSLVGRAGIWEIAPALNPAFSFVSQSVVQIKTLFLFAIAMPFSIIGRWKLFYL
jgi:hypothetical protein